MVFKKNVEREQIEEFENNTLRQISILPMFIHLKEVLSEKKFLYKLEVQHGESDLKKYHSELAINIFNEGGESVCEYDEPNCNLMLCETICFVHKGHIVGIDLLTDKDFLVSLQLLIKQVEIIKN